MREGDVVMVAGKLDDRVRNSNATPRVGTVINISESEAQVLLENGDIWRGPLREVFPIEEQS